MSLPLFCPWLSLRVPVLSQVVPILSLAVPVLSLAAHILSLFLWDKMIQLLSFCSLSLTMVEVGAKVQVPEIKGGLVLINTAKMTYQM